MNNQLKRLVFMAMFIALSVVGAYIKIPSPTGTVALDSMPGYLAATILGGVPGGIIGFMGHFITAVYTGFPLSLPIHLIVGLQMALTMVVYAWISKKMNLNVAVVIAALLNGIGSPAILSMIPGYGMGFFMAMAIPLLVGSVVNVVLAAVVYKALEKSKVIEKMDVIHYDK